MIKLGIVGAENSHCRSIAKVCNIDQAVDCRAVCVWGETPEFARESAAAGQIPTIVSDWREMLGTVDGVMIDHRHAKYHAEVATFFVEHDVPCFVDKPFTFTLAEGKQLCRLARQRGVPITSFSVKVLQDGFAEFRDALGEVGSVAFCTSSGPADIDSQYGGVFFYGIHQVDPVIELFGPAVETVSLRRCGRNALATLWYGEGPVVTINCLNNGLSTFHASVVGDKGILDWTFGRDPAPHLAGAKLFTEMFRTGVEPIAHERMLAPIAVLEALAESLRSGGPVQVADVAQV